MFIHAVIAPPRPIGGSGGFSSVGRIRRPTVSISDSRLTSMPSLTFSLCAATLQSTPAPLRPVIISAPVITKPSTAVAIPATWAMASMSPLASSADFVNPRLRVAAG